MAERQNFLKRRKHARLHHFRKYCSTSMSVASTEKNVALLKKTFLLRLSVISDSFLPVQNPLFHPGEDQFRP